MSAGKVGQLTFETLYANHHQWLRAWLRRRLGCSDNAADLAHDTFARVIAGTHRSDEGRLNLDGLREPRAFLSTIAHGLVVNHWRRLEIERAYLQALALQPEALAPSPEDCALIVETLMGVDAMLASLPEKVRRAFLMAQLDGMPYRQIAAELGVSERMVKKYMAAAMLHCLRAAGPEGA